MWLLDANMDVHLAQMLHEFGVPCDTAAKRGWKALSNGDLVAVAIAAGFTCLLTRDQLFGESAAPLLASLLWICSSNAGRPIGNSSWRHGVRDPSSQWPPP
jgi:hypothetical protein